MLKNVQKRKINKFGRNWRIFKNNEFKEELEKSSWDNVTSPHIDTNTSVSNFHFKIETLLDEMAPVKRLTKKEIGLQQRPWITPDIMSDINERNKLYKEFIEEKSPDSKIDKYNTYKAKRNLVTSRLRKAEKDFHTAFFEENKDKVKETWKGIRNLINVSKKATTNIEKIIENGKETTNTVEIANALNTFYVNIGKTIEEKNSESKYTIS